MEKEWDDFFVTGRVNDYLSYKDHYKEEAEEQKVHGTITDCDMEGDKHHADFRL